MNRVTLINAIIRKKNIKRYLEIGSAYGGTFLRIEAKYKYAVDPFNIISSKDKYNAILRDFKNFRNKYIRSDSDSFFQNIQKYVKNDNEFDLIFIDGLHTYNASLKDVLNALKNIKKDGTIVMHDCFPPYKAAALPTKNFPTEEDVRGVEGWKGQWCGDVYKSIVYLKRKFSKFLDITVFNSDFGLGVIQVKSKIEIEHLNIDQHLYDEIDKLTYDDLTNDTEGMINLKESEYFKTVIEKL